MSNNRCNKNIYAFLALGISLIAMGDPREFFISCVNEHIPEFQMEFSFAVSSKGKKSSIYHTTATVVFLWLAKMCLVKIINLCSVQL